MLQHKTRSILFLSIMRSLFFIPVAVSTNNAYNPDLQLAIDFSLWAHVALTMQSSELSNQ